MELNNYLIKKQLNDPLVNLKKRMSLEYDNISSSPEFNNFSNLQKWREAYFRSITKGSLRASILCLISITLGSTFLNLPYLMKTSGIILGLILFFLSAFISHWTLQLLADIAIKEGMFEFTDLVQIYFSKRWVILTEIMNIINCVGTLLVWDKVISNLSENLLQYFSISEYFYDSDYTNLIVCLMIVFFIQVPLCTFKAFSKFHILSILGSVLTIYIMTISIFEFPFFFKTNFSWEKLQLFNFDIHIFQTLCFFFFAFGNHTTILNAISELDPNTERRINKLVHYTSYSEVLLYLITMLVGYFSTFDATEEIYINRNYQSIFMIVGKISCIIINTCNVGLYYFMIKPYLHNSLNINFQDDEK